MKEYILTYIYRVPLKYEKQFLIIQKEAGKLYEDYGALSDVTYEGTSLNDKYGCTGISSIIPIVDEKIFLGISKFKDKAHHDEVMAKVDKDLRINQLYDELCKILDIKKIIRGGYLEV